MLPRGLIGYHESGRVFAIAEARELLVHDGESEAPLWRKSLDGEIARIAITGDEILVVTRDADVVRFSLEGKERGKNALGSEALDAAARKDGTLVVAHPMRLSLLKRGDLVATELPLAGIDALAWSGDGSKLLLAQGSQLREVSSASWEETREPVAIEASATAIAWSAAGKWLVASGDRVLTIAPGGSATERLTHTEGHVITDVAASLDGRRFAIQLGEDVVAVLDDPPGETVAQLVYPEMRVRGVRFGPAPWLGVALHQGDANNLNLSTGALHRSDTHPGRTHHSWLVQVGGTASKRAEPAKPAPKPAPKPAAAPAYTPAYDPPPPAEPEISPFTVIRIVIFGISVIVLLARACH